MRKILQTSLFACLLILSNTGFSAVSPKDVIKKGTKLVYDVNYLGTNYEFTITVKDIENGYNFDWHMSPPDNKNGSMGCSKNAIENTTCIYNYFSNENANITDQCCIVLSNKMFEAFKNNGSLVINTDKKNNISAAYGNAYNHTQSFNYDNNANNEFDCTTVNDGRDYQITFINSQSFPLIIELKLDWTMRLKKIYN